MTTDSFPKIEALFNLHYHFDTLSFTEAHNAYKEIVEKIKKMNSNIWITPPNVGSDQTSIYFTSEVKCLTSDLEEIFALMDQINKNDQGSANEFIYVGDPPR